MKKTLSLILAVVLCISLCACSVGKEQATSPTDGSSITSDTVLETSNSEEELAFPYEDSEGRVHYQLYINGELINTQHDPYTYPSEPNGAYYPIVEILSHFGVECLFDENLHVLTTQLNGNVITCKADSSDIVIGNKTLGGTAPEYIDGCFYVPSYTFMELMNAIVDFTTDRSGATITTDMVVDSATSGIDGLSISQENIPSLGKQLYTGAEACSSCGGTGQSICTFCSGTGSVTQYTQTYDPVTKQYKMQSTRSFCSRCGGSGHVTCAMCGGSGKR
jgi:hypothetical protein